jgi:hypothetical protein
VSDTHAAAVISRTISHLLLFMLPAAGAQRFHTAVLVSRSMQLAAAAVLLSTVQLGSTSILVCGSLVISSTAVRLLRPFCDRYACVLHVVVAAFRRTVHVASLLLLLLLLVPQLALRARPASLHPPIHARGWCCTASASMQGQRPNRHHPSQCR